MIGRFQVNIMNLVIRRRQQQFSYEHHFYLTLAYSQENSISNRLSITRSCCYGLYDCFEFKYTSRELYCPPQRSRNNTLHARVGHFSCYLNHTFYDLN
jgi:hypothetical protein